MTFEPGTRFGQYRIIRLLGRGGMGVVYEVEHQELRKRYALKLLPPDLAASADAIRRFKREARLMANLEHPNIVRVEDNGETSRRYWLRMELINGIQPGVVSLGDYATKVGYRIEQREFAGILRQILAALAHAHSKGVVHRDIKPGNILLEMDHNGGVRVKVSDFGLARVIEQDAVRAFPEVSLTQITATGGALLGTIQYMSPEQLRGEPVDARADIYAVGLICYRLLTAHDVGRKSITQLVSGMNPAWDSFVDKALEQRAETRYANGGEMLAAFERLEIASLHTVDNATSDNRSKGAKRHLRAEISRPRILILDDEEGPRTAMQMILDRDGMDCSMADSGDEAITLAQRKKFDVIISDIAHPGLRGLDLIPVWKQLQPNARVIIVSAGLDLKGVEQRAKALGASVCLSKPFTASQIRDAVQSLLPTA